MLRRAVFCVVRLTAHVSNGCKSRIYPVIGKILPKAMVLQATINLKEVGYGEPTTPRTNLWFDGQKSYRRLCMRMSLLYKIKPDSYTRSWTVNTTDRWRERNVWYPGRSVRNALKRVTITEM